MNCIFCDLENSAKSIEHIVPESLGNKDYTLEKGRVCDVCNNNFSKFESVALTNSIFLMERARFAIKTKRGRNVKGKIAGLEIQGNEEFKEGFVNIKGLSKDNFTITDTNTRTGQLFIKSFDKSEVAASKLLLKIGLEALFTSQRKIFRKYDFSELKLFLAGKSNTDWPFVTSDFNIDKFQSIPRFGDKLKLKSMRCKLSYQEIDKNTLLFSFKYGGVSMVINLINQNLRWVKDYLANDSVAVLYPDHYNRKLIYEKAT